MNSIVITTYERPQILSQCIRALSRQKGIEDCEVIVVDDGSRADLRAIERQWKAKLNFRLMPIRHAGRAGARNRGVKAASGARILFLGDDILVRPGWLEQHLRSGQDSRDIAVLGPCPLQLPESGKTLSPAYRKVLDPVNLAGIRDPKNAGFAFFATGNLSMDREAFLEIGGFDTQFERYGWEDIDLGYRFEKAGGRLMFDEKAKAIHVHPMMTRNQVWRRETDAGYTAYQFWSKWRNEDVEFVKFWNEGSSAGPPWRRRLGAALIELFEAVAPNSSVLPNLYERMIYAHRHAGAELAKADAANRPLGSLASVQEVST